MIIPHCIFDGEPEKKARFPRPAVSGYPESRPCLYAVDRVLGRFDDLAVWNVNIVAYDLKYYFLVVVDLVVIERQIDQSVLIVNNICLDLRTRDESHIFFDISRIFM